ncbi:hypothetical protein BSK65_10680 [Paenibacillus odorifer]|uniref:Uncharacterized protein n=1 Tax=Paenibacillus odorifer TaxID=189426 RepID=A0A1R0ZJS7_9BACL|nr:hypothetical protein BSK65_10680 [Paenibacillus odorifer]
MVSDAIATNEIIAFFIEAPLLKSYLDRYSNYIKAVVHYLSTLSHTYLKLYKYLQLSTQLPYNINEQFGYIWEEDPMGI